MSISAFTGACSRCCFWLTTNREQQHAERIRILGIWSEENDPSNTSKDNTKQSGPWNDKNRWRTTQVPKLTTQTDKKQLGSTNKDSRGSWGIKQRPKLRFYPLRTLLLVWTAACCVGTPACWCVGTLVCWCVGTLVCWCVGAYTSVLMCWCVH